MKLKNLMFRFLFVNLIQVKFILKFYFAGNLFSF